jgi:hypothetical protein
MSEALDTLQANYFTLTENLDDYLDRCKTDDQRNALKAEYQQARLDFYTARNKAFAANDPDIIKAVADLKTAQDSLQKLTQQLADIAKVITAVTTAVKLGTELVHMGM